MYGDHDALPLALAEQRRRVGANMDRLARDDLRRRHTEAALSVTRDDDELVLTESVGELYLEGTASAA
jgi:hypothetical protein